MNRYIKSEFYRLIRNKWTYLFIVICSVLLLSANIILAAVKSSEPNFPYATTAFSISCFYTNMIMIFLLCISVASMVFGNEYSNHTMKNSISYGISRTAIYFGKLAVEIVYAFIAFVIITGIYLLSAYLMLENSGFQDLKLLLRIVFACLPLFLLALAVTNCFTFIIESTGAAVSAIIGVLMVLPIISNFLGMKFKFFYNLSNVLPYNMINSIKIDPKNYTLQFYWDTTIGYQMYWLIGILQIVIFALIGYAVYRRKEIK